MLAIDKARRLRSRPEQCAPPAPETQRALRPRPQNPHRSRPTKQRPFLPAVSSLRGFRTPAPRKTPRACKGPASETLQHSGHSPRRRGTTPAAAEGRRARGRRREGRRCRPCRRRLGRQPRRHDRGHFRRLGAAGVGFDRAAPLGRRLRGRDGGEGGRTAGRIRPEAVIARGWPGGARRGVSRHAMLEPRACAWPTWRLRLRRVQRVQLIILPSFLHDCLYCQSQIPVAVILA